MKNVWRYVVILMCIGAVFCGAEETLWNALNPKPYDPEVDPDIDQFMASRNERPPEIVRGALYRTKLLSPLRSGNPLRPESKGAVLTGVKAVSHAFIPPHKKTIPATLSGEQEICFVYEGRGSITCGGKTAELRDGIGLLIPPDVSFTMENSGDDPLAMYIITEPIPGGFTPNTELVVKDEYGRPLTERPGHWSHIGSNSLFSEEDGLAVLTGCRPVYFAPLTMSQPHSHNEASEEIWLSIRGDDTRILLGKKMRNFPAGTVYKVPPDGISPHANINISDRTIKVFWMMKSGPGEQKPYSMLEGSPYNPDRDVNIDMFIRNGKESPPVTVHGALIERDVFTRCPGDPRTPTTRGAVFKTIRRFAHATLYPQIETTPVTPDGEQELFYIVDGKGTITGGGETFALYPGIGVLIPEGVTFTLENTGKNDLTMYHLVEPVHNGFTPGDHIVWRDTNLEPYHTITAHWVNHNKWLIRQNEGLSDLKYFLTVTIMPGDFSQPHSHGTGDEEVWCPIDGDIHILLGKQLRRLEPGTAFMIPPDDRTPHAHFNISGKPVTFLYFGRFGNPE